MLLSGHKVFPPAAKESKSFQSNCHCWKSQFLSRTLRSVSRHAQFQFPIKGFWKLPHFLNLLLFYFFYSLLQRVSSPVTNSKALFNLCRITGSKIGGYRCGKCTRCPEFKSWMRLFAFHIALKPLGNVRIQLLFLQLWVDSRTDCVP